tara:strand:- start:13 stop:288 length:276 start_codon:yes stop_codon:yes gene_type:complete
MLVIMLLEMLVLVVHLLVVLVVALVVLKHLIPLNLGQEVVVPQILDGVHEVEQVMGIQILVVQVEEVLDIMEWIVLQIIITLQMVYQVVRV